MALWKYRDRMSPQFSDKIEKIREFWFVSFLQSQSVDGWLGVRDKFLVFLHFSKHFRAFSYKCEKVLSYGDDRNVAKCMTLWKCRDRMTPKRRISKKVLSYGDGNVVWMLPCPASLAIPLRQPPVGGTLRMRACGVRSVLIQCLIYRKVLLEFEDVCMLFLCAAFRIQVHFFCSPERVKSVTKPFGRRSRLCESFHLT